MYIFLIEVESHLCTVPNHAILHIAQWQQKCIQDQTLNLQKKVHILH